MFNIVSNGKLNNMCPFYIGRHIIKLMHFITKMQRSYKYLQLIQECWIMLIVAPSVCRTMSAWLRLYKNKLSDSLWCQAWHRVWCPMTSTMKRMRHLVCAYYVHLWIHQWLDKFLLSILVCINTWNPKYHYK